MLILAADCHLAENTENLKEFKEFLKIIEESNCDICFLGDIMDLWIALPKFEVPWHKEFLKWCEKEKSKRNIFFLEGNHEFFVAKNYPAAFTSCEANLLFYEDLIFAHGDLIQRKQFDHLLFRRFSKSSFAYFLLKYLPFSKQLVACIQNLMRKKAKKYVNVVPLKEIKHWTKKQEFPAGHKLFLGHFHQAYSDEDSDKQLYCLPAWRDSREIALYKKDSKSCKFLHWKELTKELRSRSKIKTTVL